MTDQEFVSEWTRRVLKFYNEEDCEDRERILQLLKSDAGSIIKLGLAYEQLVNDIKKVLMPLSTKITTIKNE